MSKRPNLLIFVPDSYRGDVLGHLGDPAAVTPHLDACVADGAVSFSQTFAQNPVCTPSRCSFMTGLYPHVHGHRSMKHMLKPHEPNLLGVLKAGGYHVWWGGKNDLIAVETRADYLRVCDTKFQRPGIDTGLRLTGQPPPGSPLAKAYYHGLREPTGEPGLHTDQDAEWVQGAVDFIGSYDNAERPWCIYLPLVGPHPAYEVEARIRARIAADRLPPRIPASALRGTPGPAIMDAMRLNYDSAGVTEDEWRELKAVYYGMCTRIDDLFGEVVAALKARGVWDDTLAVFFSDHGDFTGDYDLPEKAHSTLQDVLLRVPLIIKPPRGVAVQPGVRTHLCELVDVCATIYDLLGIDPGYDVQGRSLRASLAGADAPIRDAVFAEVGSRAGEPQFVNTDVYKLPPDSFYAIQSRAAIASHTAGSYAVACRTTTHKYVRRPYTHEHELYDLRLDPGETNNLASDGDSAHAELAARLADRLLDFFLQTADVLPQIQDSRSI